MTSNPEETATGDLQTYALKPSFLKRISVKKVIARLLQWQYSETLEMSNVA
jgi:hypothetical protein